jgi:hypothetical protein
MRTLIIGFVYRISRAGGVHRTKLDAAVRPMRFARRTFGAAEHLSACTQASPMGGGKANHCSTCLRAAMLAELSAAIPALAHSSLSSTVVAPLTPQPPSITPSSTMGSPPRCPRGGMTLPNEEIRNPRLHRSDRRSLGQPIIAAAVATPREDRSTPQPTQPSIRLNAISRPSLSQTATLILALSCLARRTAPSMTFLDFESVSIEGRSSKSGRFSLAATPCPRL